MLVNVRAPFSMGKKNITCLDLSDVISKEFKVLEEKIDSKLESYRKELHELAREPIIHCM